MRYILFSVGRDMLEARQQTPQNRRCQLEGEKKNLCYSTTIFDVHMHTRLNQCEKGCFRHHILLLNFYSYPYTHHHSSCFFLSCFLVRLRLTLLLNEVQIDAHFHLLFRVHVSLSYPYNLHVHRCHPCYPCTCVLIAAKNDHIAPAFSYCCCVGWHDARFHIHHYFRCDITIAGRIPKIK